MDNPLSKACRCPLKGARRDSRHGQGRPPHHNRWPALRLPTGAQRWDRAANLPPGPSHQKTTRENSALAVTAQVSLSLEIPTARLLSFRHDAQKYRRKCFFMFFSHQQILATRCCWGTVLGTVRVQHQVGLFTILSPGRCISAVIAYWRHKLVSLQCQWSVTSRWLCQQEKHPYHRPVYS